MTNDNQGNADQDGQGLLCAYILDETGSGKLLDWPFVNSWTPDQGMIWVHLDCLSSETGEWLNEKANLDPVIIEGLTASETRPRCDLHSDGVLMILRGVNLSPNADPEDMVSIRIWVDRNRVISTRLRPLRAIEDLRSQIAHGIGPVSPGHFVARLAWQLADRMEPVIQDLSEQLDTLEDRLDETREQGQGHGELRDIRHPLLDLRRVTISLRRYLAPQRVAISTFSQLDGDWIDERIRGRLREATDRTVRITEELDEIRERTIVVQDELANRISHRMEKTMYVLTIVATIMLPLGFLTGLLGINVGGIPGAETSWAFWAVCVGLAGMVGMEAWLFRRMGWL